MPIPVTSGFLTEAASDNKIIRYGVTAATTLTVIGIITFIVALIVVLIKKRRKKIRCAHQGAEGNWDEHMHVCTDANGSPSMSLYMQRSYLY